MDYKQFSADILTHNTLQFSSSEENEEAMKQMGVEQTVRQLDAGAFSCAVSDSTSARADFVSDRFSTSLSVYLEAPADAVLLLIPRSPSGEFYASGKNLANNNILLIPEGQGVDIVTQGLSGSDTIIFQRAEFLAMTNALNINEAHFEHSINISADTTTLQQLRQGIVQQVTRCDEYGDEDVNNFLVSALINLGGQGVGQQQEYAGMSGKRIKVAKQVQAYIEAYFSEPISSDHLCHITGVGMRTLQRCFGEYFNVTISHYLKARRLDAAYRQLVAADPESSIANIALAQGFTHLGRFSTEFGRYFGCSPKTVLKSKQS